MYSYDVSTKVSPNFKALPKGAVNVSEKLIKGSSLNIKDVISLKKENVKLIIDLRHFARKYITFPERTVSKVAGIDYVRFPVSFKDGKFVSMKDFDTFIKMIDNTDGRVYVHCSGGRHRSTIFCGAYMLKKGGSSPEHTLKWMLDQDYITKKFVAMKTQSTSPHKRERSEKILNGLELTLRQFKELFDIKSTA